ncbi:unnamed protein product [Vicia faba]|uniref:Uncharacterized protein n=1 Tax=Vicia faba TaxID=3906 RepID=A0AAV0ZBR5_VICFA|nr:unnamed protein product [Vicia faba]
MRGRRWNYPLSLLTVCLRLLLYFPMSLLVGETSRLQVIPLRKGILGKGNVKLWSWGALSSRRSSLYGTKRFCDQFIKHTRSFCPDAIISVETLDSFKSALELALKGDPGTLDPNVSA